MVEPRDRKLRGGDWSEEPAATVFRGHWLEARRRIATADEICSEDHIGREGLILPLIAHILLVMNENQAAERLLRKSITHFDLTSPFAHFARLSSPRFYRTFTSP